MQTLLTCIAFAIMPLCAFSQSDSSKINTTSAMRFTVENDVLLPTHTDRYYTNGFELAYFTNKPILNNRLSKLLSKPNGQRVVGLIATAQMYTPSSILTEHHTLLETAKIIDRPYAGLMTLGLQYEFNDPASSTRVTTTYSAGVIGKAAQQEHVQIFFHKLLNRPIPNWEKQLPTDLALNINFRLDKRLLHFCDYSEVFGYMVANVGTLTNAVKVGSTLKMGIFQDFFKGSLHQEGEMSFFFSPNVCFFYDNALLEGGIFTRSNHRFQYAIPREAMKQFCYELSFGATLNIKKVKLLYTQNLRSAEFDTAKTTYWGGFSVLVPI
jgi:lipid A 3-O-deacylase